MADPRGVLEMNHTLVIAEAGVNHNGDLKLAFQLVEAAAQAGADVVKFQTFQAQELATGQADKAAYQTETTGEEESQLAMLRKLELTFEQHFQLIDHCQFCGIEFLSTAFDSPSIDLLASLSLKRWKIPSGEITNHSYLCKIGSLNQPVIISTGMANLGEIEAAIDVLEQANTRRDQITVLHCTTEYPAPLDEVNLRAMETIARSFGVAVGYSDHTVGISVPIAAVALGATVIEKHLTLDRTMNGPDHLASLEPDQFAAMVEGIRAIECALGDGIKRPTASERINLPIVRKSLVAARAIQVGEPFSVENITAKRPGFGISPMHLDSLLSRKATRAYAPDDLIEW
jgi:N,N'-diacetyllegionaminate synthase